MRFGKVCSLSFIAGCLTLSAAPDQVSPTAISCTRPDGYHILEEVRTCPVGDETYTALRLSTHSTFGRYLDMTQKSYLQFPVAVPVCPGNGFVDFKQDYSEQEMAILQAAIARPEFRENLGKNTSWYLFARMIELSGLDGFDVWWLYSRAAAEAYNCDQSLYAGNVHKALSEIERAVAEEAQGSDAYWAMSLMASNYHRRLGDFDTARGRMTMAGEYPEGWSDAFETLAHAIDLGTSDPVSIGEYQRKDD